MYRNYANWIVKWRWLVLVLSVLCVAACMSQIDKVKFSNDYKDFFQPDDPAFKTFQLVQDAYSSDSGALVMFAPKDKTVFTPATLAAIEKFTAEAWQLPYARRVDSITNFQHTQAAGDDITVKNLVRDAAKLSPDQLARIKATALAEPFLVNKLVSPSGHVTGVSINFVLGASTETALPEAVKALRKQIDAYRIAHPDMKIAATGTLLLDEAFNELAEQDLVTLTPLMFLVILIVMFFCLRSALGMLSTLCVLTCAVIAALGLTGLAGIKFTAISTGAPTVIMTISIAACMHLLISIMQEMGGGKTKHEAIAAALEANIPILFVVTATDVLGFLSMRLSDVPPIGDFGTIIAFGAVASFLLAVTMLPAAVAVLPFKAMPSAQQRSSRYARAALKLMRYRSVTIIAMTALTLACGYWMTLNRFEDNFVNYFSESVPFRTETDFISKNLTGVHDIQYSLPAPSAAGIADLGYQKTLERFTEWLRKQPEVLSVTSLTDIVKRVNRSMHGDDPAHYRLPDNTNELGQYLLLFEMSLPPGQELNEQIRVDRQAAKLTVVVRNGTSIELLDFDRRAQQWLKDNAPSAMQVQGTSASIMFSRIGELNVKGMMEGYALQLLLISGMVMLVLRSVKMGLLSLAPNVIPAILAFGAWGLLVGEIGLSVSVVAVMTYGIIVDDTIHTVFKYHQARHKLRMSIDDAVQYVYFHAGHSIFSTTLILVAGFSVLAFSNFELNRDLGIMAACTIALAAVVDFVLVPALLSLGKRQARGPFVSPVVLRPAPAEV